MTTPKENLPPPAGSPPSPGSEPNSSPEPTAAAKIGKVVLDDRYLDTPANPLETPGVKEFQDRIERSRRVAEQFTEENPFLNENHLRAVLQNALDRSQLAGILIATRDGLVIAQVSREASHDHLPIIGALIEETTRRAEAEGIIGRMDELLFRGAGGELVAVRYFRETGQDFFLLVHAPRRCAYRRETNRILRECGPLLANFT